MTLNLKEKKVLLGVTGGIAAYKSAELLRLLIKEGAKVRVVMTQSAAKFVSPLTFQALSGNPVITDLFSDVSGIDHIEHTDWADIFIVAPATANIIGKMASGIGDDPLSTMALAFDGRFLIAPAMNSKMYKNPIVQENIDRLQSHGYQFVGPEAGDLACGEEGIGRMSEPEAILDEAISLLYRKDLAGKRIIVTAGPTRENIDPVRFISNRSSGKMGYAIAGEAARRGAEVTLISGPASIRPPSGADLVKVTTSDEMYRAVLEKADGADAVIMAAAVSDYRPTESLPSKIKKGKKNITLDLEKTVDIIEELGKKKRGSLLVGFAAETENLIENARKKLKAKNLDLIVANDVTEEGAGFDADTNRVFLIDRNGVVEETPKLSKGEVAARIVDLIRERLP